MEHFTHKMFGVPKVPVGKSSKNIADVLDNMAGGYRTTRPNLPPIELSGAMCNVQEAILASAFYQLVSPFENDCVPRIEIMEYDFKYAKKIGSWIEDINDKLNQYSKENDLDIQCKFDFTTSYEEVLESVKDNSLYSGKIINFILSNSKDIEIKNRFLESYQRISTSRFIFISGVVNPKY